VSGENVDQLMEVLTSAGIMGRTTIDIVLVQGHDVSFIALRLHETGTSEETDLLVPMTREEIFTFCKSLLKYTVNHPEVL